MYHIILIMALLLATTAQAADSSRLQALEQEIAKLSQSLAKDETKHETLSEKLKEIDTSIHATSAKLNAITAQMTAAEQEVKTLNREQQAAMQALQQNKSKLKSQLRHAYLNQDTSVLKILLNQDDPHEMQRLLGYYRYVNNARRNEIKQLSESIIAIDIRSKLITQKMVELKAIQEDQLMQQATFQKEHQQRNMVLAALNKDMAKKSKRIKALQEDARGLNKIIARLETSNKTSFKTAFDASRGGLKWPTEGALLHAFNSPREGDTLKWSGVFISAKEGAPVRAIHEGKVVFADYLRGYGNLVIVDHGDKYMSLYANNETLHKKLGDKVSIDETVATVGKNGTMPISGLYFEIRRSGQPVDPSAWIKKHL